MFRDNTKYQMIDENSPANEERFFAFVTQSSEGVWRIELERPVPVDLPADEQIELFFRYSVLAECNEAMARMYGFAAAGELVGARLGELLPPEDQNNIDYLRAFIASNYRLENAESREIDRDGRPKIFLNNLTGIIENGSVVRAWGTQRDVTAQKEVEKAKAHLAAIVESSDDAIISKDLNGVIMSWNRGAEKVFGYTAAEAVGRSITMLIPPPLLSEETEILGRIRRGESIEHYETRRQRRDGTLINISLTVSPIRSESGQIIGASKIARDITERKATENKLRESEDRYRTLFTSVDEGFCIFEMLFDADGRPSDYRFLEVNPAFERMTGLENAVGRTALEMIPNLELHWVETYGRVALTGEAVRFTERSEAMGRWFDVYAVRVGGAESRRVALIFNNITERKKAEEKLRESEERFAKAFNSSPLVLTITSLKTGRLIEVNETFVTATGYTREETIGRTTDELGLWARAGDREQELGLVRKNGEIRDLEYVFRVRDGREIVGLLSAQQLEIRGEPCALTVIQDITERKKAAEISERYRLLSMRARDIILFFRPDGRIVDANRLAVETYGYEQSELLEMSIHDLRAPETLTVIDEQLARADDGGTQFETLHRRRDGSTFPVEVTSVGADVGGERLLISIVRDITERRKNEEIVRKSAKQLALVTAIAPVYIAQCDSERRFKFVNKAYAERFGLRPEDCVGRPIAEIIGERTTGLIDRYVETVLTGQPVEFELEIPYPKIGNHYMHCSYAPEFDEDGRVVGWVAAVTDISERRRMEEAIRESESGLRKMADAMPQVVWIADENGEVYYYNHRASEFAGIEKGVDGTWRWQPVLHPDDLEATVCEWEKSVAEKTVYAKEHRLQMKDGGFRWHLSRAIPVFNEQGRVLKWYGTATDIHDLKQTEDALIKAERRASEEYLALLSRIVPVGQTLGTARDLLSIYRALHDFVRATMPCTAFFVSFYNPEKSLRTAAYAWGEEGEVDISLLPPMPLTADGGPNSQAIFEKKSVVVNRYWDLMKNRPHVVLQDNGLNPNSSLVVPMKVMSRIIGTLEVQAYEEGVFTNEHIIALEMVANLAAVAIENVRLLQVEAEAREAAETANRAKDEFLSVLSHELRTPLNSMLGWIRMMRAGVLDEERSRKAVEVIERNTLLQNNLIEDLLDVSRIISGKMRIEKEAVDLVGIFGDTIENLRPVAAQKKIRFEFETAETSLIIHGDATRLQQILTNLVQNAVKFTDEGGRVEILLERRGDLARLVVRDDGIGIDGEILPHIFERFQQADSSTKRVYSGLGLGLTIVRNLVGLHGGVITAKSDGAGKGATFTVEFPLTREFLERSTATGKAAAAAESALDGARILLVDDDAESLVPLQVFLEREGAEIVLATSAREALEKLARENFHILITDIGMPVADGYDLLARVRQLQTEQNAFITAIALTAYASSDDRRRALASGFQDHFAKPVDYDELLATVKKIFFKVESGE
ncbi:MAG: PAS domain S-box protein [Acidobacteria bacterium]|nr:PAS domain S-box protein [Acidobacteriota bacterium]